MRDVAPANNGAPGAFHNLLSSEIAPSLIQGAFVAVLVDDHRLAPPPAPLVHSLTNEAATHWMLQCVAHAAV